MTLNLTPEQHAWINAQVARGEFTSVADGVRQLIDERIAERMAEEQDDLAWARPLVDGALAAVERGDVIGRDEHRARNATRLAALKECQNLCVEMQRQSVIPAQAGIQGNGTDFRVALDPRFRGGDDISLKMIYFFSDGHLSISPTKAAGRLPPDMPIASRSCTTG